MKLYELTVQTRDDGQKVLEVEANSRAEAIRIARELDAPVVVTSILSVKDTLFQS